MSTRISSVVSRDRGTLWIGACSCLALLCLLTGLPATGQTIRSFYYDGSSEADLTFEHHESYDSTVEMTVEAWIYRASDSPDRSETIISHDWQTSYWLGFYQGSLRFYRSGGLRVNAEVNVPLKQWVHVAAVYDGTTVHFYINGLLVSSKALANGGAGMSRPLSVGGDATGYNFLGNIALVRVWSRALSQAEIEAGLYIEQIIDPDLVAGIPGGSSIEWITGQTGTLGSGVTSSVRGLLPRNLRAPQAASEITVDGRNDGTEFYGAEELLIRYDYEVLIDKYALLVHRDNNLYLNFAPASPPGWSFSDSYIGVNIDPDSSGGDTPDGSDFQIRIYPDGRESELMVGDGAGGWTACSDCVEPGTWEVGKYTCADLNPPCLEIRISRSLLGDSSTSDGFMLGHFNPSDARVGPVNAVSSDPSTWARLSFSSTGSVLPRVMATGSVQVFRGECSESGTACRTTDDCSGGADTCVDAWRPFAGHEVWLRTASGVLASTTTSSIGGFGFTEDVPPGRGISIQVAGCEYCRFLDPLVTSTAIDPESMVANEVFFSPCTGFCQYSPITFRLMDGQYVGPVAIDSVTPSRGNQRVILRGGGEKVVEPTEVTISGSHMQAVTPWLIRKSGTCIPAAPESCTMFQAPVLEKEADGTQIRVQVPDLGEGPISAGWWWALYDSWTRPGYTEVVLADFLITDPQYPLQHGLGFANEGDIASLGAFDGTFGKSGFLCIGGVDIDGFCVIPPFGPAIPWTRDPLYSSLAFPLYQILLGTADGSCVGMSSTSLLMSHGELDPERFDSAAHYANGFIGTAPKPESYTPDERVWGMVRPNNLWAHIRSNHGVQLSAESLAAQLSQMADFGSFTGYPTNRYNEIGASLRERVILMYSGGSGHSVVPWAVEELGTTGRIWVYDNNAPCNGAVVNESHPCLDRFIDIDTLTDTYSFPAASYSGRGIWSIPLQVWRNPRHAPIDLGGILMAVFGGADGHYLGSDGSEWGWKADGVFVDAYPGAMAVFPYGASEEGIRDIPLLLPPDAEAPVINVNLRSADYMFYGAQGGTAVLFEALGATPGTTDRIVPETSEGRLRSFAYTEAGDPTAFFSRAGMMLGDGQRALYTWSGIDLPSGETASFGAEPATRSAIMTNSSGSALAADLVVTVTDAGEGVHSTTLYGPFTIDAGATHSVELESWPDASQLRSSIDRDGDGVAEETTLVSGLDCEAAAASVGDCNANGLADSCDLAAGTAKDRNLNLVPDECEVDPPPISQAGSSTKVIPAAAHVSGSAGTNWVSDLVLYNHTTSTIANLYFLAAGQDNSNVAAEQVVVGAGTSVKLADAVEELFALSSAAGAIMVGSEVPLLVTSRTYNDADSGTYGQYIPGQDLSEAVTGSTKAKLIQLTKSSRFRTNVGFFNATAIKEYLTVELFAADATPLGYLSYTLEPYGYLQANDVFGQAGVSSIADGYAVVYSQSQTARYYTYASTVDNTSGDPIYITPMVATAEPIYIPAAAHVRGSNETNWRTDLEVHNQGSSKVTFAIELMKANQSNTSPPTVTFYLDAGMSRRFEDVLLSLFSFNGTGALRVSADGRIGVSSRTYNDLGSSTFGQYIPGYPAGTSIQTGELMRLVQLSHSTDSEAGFRSNIGLTSTAAVPITVTIYLYTQSGAYLGSRTVDLAPYSYTQENNIFAAVSSEDQDNAYALIHSGTLEAGYFAYASVVDNRSGDPVFVPAR